MQNSRVITKFEGLALSFYTHYYFFQGCIQGEIIIADFPANILKTTNLLLPLVDILLCLFFLYSFKDSLFTTGLSKAHLMKSFITCTTAAEIMFIKYIAEFKILAQSP